MSSDTAITESLTTFYLRISDVIIPLIAGLISYGLSDILGVGWDEKIGIVVTIYAATMLLMAVFRKPPRRKVLSRIMRFRWFEKWLLPYQWFGKNKLKDYAQVEQNRENLIGQEHFGNTIFDENMNLNKSSIVYMLFKNEVNNILTFFNRYNVQTYYKQFVDEYWNNRAKLISTNIEMISQPPCVRNLLVNCQLHNKMWFSVSLGDNYNAEVQFWNVMMLRAILYNNLIHHIEATTQQIQVLMRLIKAYIEKQTITVDDFYVLQRLVMFDIIVHRSQRNVRVGQGNQSKNVWFNALQAHGNMQNVNVRNALMRDCSMYGNIVKCDEVQLKWTSSYDYLNVQQGNNYVVQEFDADVRVGINCHFSIMDFDDYKMYDYVNIKRANSLLYHMVYYRDESVLQIYGGKGKYKNAVRKHDKCYLNIMDEKKQTEVRLLNKSGAELFFNNVDHNEHSVAHALSKLKMLELVNANVGHSVFEVASSLTAIHYTDGMNFSVANLNAHDAVRMGNVLNRCDQLVKMDDNENFISLTIGQLNDIRISKMRVDKVLMLNVQFDLLLDDFVHFMNDSLVIQAESMMNFDTRILSLPFVYNCQNEQYWQVKFSNFIPLIRGKYASRYQIKSWFNGQTQVYTHELSNIVNWVKTLRIKYHNKSFVNAIVDNNAGYLHMNMVLLERVEDQDISAAGVNLQNMKEEIMIRIRDQTFLMECAYNLTFVRTHDLGTITSWTYAGTQQRNHLVEEKLDKNLAFATADLRDLSMRKENVVNIKKEGDEWVDFMDDEIAEFNNALFRVVNLGDVERSEYERDEVLMTATISLYQHNIVDVELQMLTSRIYSIDELKNMYGITQVDEHLAIVQLITAMRDDFDIVFEVDGAYFKSDVIPGKHATPLLMIVGKCAEKIEILKEFDLKDVTIIRFDIQELPPLFYSEVYSLSESNCVNTVFEALDLRNDQMHNKIHTIQSIFNVVLHQMRRHELDEKQFEVMKTRAIVNHVNKRVVNEYYDQNEDRANNDLQHYVNFKTNVALVNEKANFERDNRIVSVNETVVTSARFDDDFDINILKHPYWYNVSTIENQLWLYFKDECFTHEINDPNKSEFRCLVFAHHIYVVKNINMDVYHRMVREVAVHANAYDVDGLDFEDRVLGELPYYVVLGREAGVVNQLEEKGTDEIAQPNDGEVAVVQLEQNASEVVSEIEDGVKECKIVKKQIEGDNEGNENERRTVKRYKINKRKRKGERKIRSSGITMNDDKIVGDKDRSRDQLNENGSETRSREEGDEQQSVTKESKEGKTIENKDKDVKTEIEINPHEGEGMKQNESEVFNERKESCEMYYLLEFIIYNCKLLDFARVKRSKYLKSSNKDRIYLKLPRLLDDMFKIRLDQLIENQRTEQEYQVIGYLLRLFNGDFRAWRYLVQNFRSHVVLYYSRSHEINLRFRDINCFEFARSIVDGKEDDEHDKDEVGINGTDDTRIDCNTDIHTKIESGKVQMETSDKQDIEMIDSGAQVNVLVQQSIQCAVIPQTGNQNEIDVSKINDGNEVSSMDQSGKFIENGTVVEY